MRELQLVSLNTETRNSKCAEGVGFRGLITV